MVHVVVAMIVSLLAGSAIHAAPLPMMEPAEGHMDSSSTPSSTGHIAIFHTDGKFDDKLAMTLAERLNGYDEMHVILNGIKDHHGSVADMHDWNRQMKAMHPGFHAAKKTFYRGGSPFGDHDVAHEALFVKPERDTSPTPRLHDLVDLPDHLRHHAGKEAHHYQIGPAPEHEVLSAAIAARQAGVKVTEMRHLLGYNSRQDTMSRKKASAKTQEYVTSLDAKMRAIHGDQARTVITNSRHNLGGSDGSTQAYHFLQGRLPQRHLDQVGSLDTFHLSQLNRVEAELRDRGLAVAPTMGRDGGPLTQADVWQMRENDPEHDPTTQALRRYNIAAIESNRAMLEEKSNIHDRLGSVLDGISKPCQGETCDANHVALHWLANQRERQGQAAYEPITIGDNIRMQSAGQGDQVHGISPIAQAYAKQDVTALMDRFFPQVQASHRSE